MKSSMRRMVLISALVAGSGIALAAQPQRGQRPPQQNGQGGQHGQQGDHRGGPTSRPSPDQLFDMADTNHDGVLSRAEFTQFIQSHRPPPPPTQHGGGGGGNDNN